MKSIKNVLSALGLATALPACLAPNANAQATENGPVGTELEPRTEDVDAVATGLFVSPSDAANAIADGALLLDARPAPAFLLSHPRGAVRVAWDDFSDPDDRGRLHPDRSVLAERLGALGVEAGRTTYVVGAWDGLWGEEGRIVWMLARLGLDAHVVSGGVDAWSAAGLPTARGPARAEARTLVLPAEDGEPSVEATLDDVAGYDLILDVRTAREFDGATPHGSSRGGHVPGARHVEWTAFLDADGNLLPPEEIRALIGAPTDARIAAYCTGGVRSGFVWAVLREAGYAAAANYAGSWWEYADSDQPVER